MNKIELITDLNSEKVEIYKENKERQLVTYFEPAEGIFIAESAKIIERALDAGYEPISVLCEVKDDVPRQADTVERIQNAYPEVPVMGAEFEVLKELIGYNLTGGILCAMRRRKLPTVEEFLEGLETTSDPSEILEEKSSRPDSDKNKDYLKKDEKRDSFRQKRIVIFDNVENPTNIGALFRSAAALGMDGVLLTSDCSDPLYRRAIRVSMGTVFQIPWTKLDDKWPKISVKMLHDRGYKLIGMALCENSVRIDDPAITTADKVAIIMGNEGDGLSDATMECLDYKVKIPMYHGVDSLNVAAAGAVALYALRNEGGNECTSL